MYWFNKRRNKDFRYLLDGYNFKWKLIYKLPCVVTYDAKSRIFQYKLLNNVLYLNKKLFHFGIISQPKCSICNLYDETPQHLFYECIYTQHLWNHLQLYISGKIALPALTALDQNYIIVNHLLLIFKNDRNKKRKISNKWKLIDNLF